MSTVLMSRESSMRIIDGPEQVPTWALWFMVIVFCVPMTAVACGLVALEASEELDRRLSPGPLRKKEHQ